MIYPILAIETTGELCSAAVLFDEDTVSEINIKMKHIHSEKLLDIIDSAFKLASSSIDEIKVVAISNGPGSFTGLRIGMATAKALAMGRNLPLIVVPTFEALAMMISLTLPKDTVFHIANKVNTTEFYCGSYKAKDEKYEIIKDITLIEKEELEELLSKGNPVFGNYNSNKFVNSSSPNASFIGLWAAKYGTLLKDYDYIEPNYLKNFVVRRPK